MAAAARPVTHHTAAYTATAPTNPPITTTGNVALWGEDVGNLYGKTITSGKADAQLRGNSARHGYHGTASDVSGLLTCLSCHDGNYATGRHDEEPSL